MNLDQGIKDKFFTFGPQEKIFVLLAFMSGIGLSFGLHSLIVGHDSTFGTTREVPWGLLVTPYFFFACTSTGLCIVASLGQVFRIKPFEPLVTRTLFLALITMATGLMCITLELENPWRVPLNAVLSPHPTSNIWWKTAIYSLYMIFIVFDLLSLYVKKNKRARIFAILGLIAVTMGNLNMNSDMGILGSRGFWSENYMPLYILSISTLAGCAMALLFTQIAALFNRESLTEDMKQALISTGKVFLVILLILLYFTGVKVMSGFYPQFATNPEAMFLLVKGHFADNFWIGEFFLGVVFPILLILISKGKNKGVLALAGISCLVGCFVLFYDMVVVGQLIPHYYQYNVVGLPKYYSYTPSLHEVMITAGAFFFFFTAFAFGEIFFKKINFGR